MKVCCVCNTVNRHDKGSIVFVQRTNRSQPVLLFWPCVVERLLPLAGVSSLSYPALCSCMTLSGHLLETPFSRQIKNLAPNARRKCERRPRQIRLQLKPNCSSGVLPPRPCSAHAQKSKPLSVRHQFPVSCSSCKNRKFIYARSGF